NRHDLFAHGSGQASGIGHAADREVCVAQTQIRKIDRLSQLDVEPTMTDIPDNADDLVRLLARRDEAQSPPKRVFGAKETLCQDLTDNDDLRILAHLSLCERAAFKKRDAHGAKIIVVDVANVGLRA